MRTTTHTHLYTVQYRCSSLNQDSLGSPKGVHYVNVYTEADLSISSDYALGNVCVLCMGTCKRQMKDRKQTPRRLII